MADSPSKVENAADARKKALERLDDSLNHKSATTSAPFRHAVRELLRDTWSLGHLESGWIYAMRLRIQDGRWVVVELRVFPDSELLNSKGVKHWLAGPDSTQEIPLGGLTARHLRRIPFSKPIFDGVMKAARPIARHYRKGASGKTEKRTLKLLRIAETYVACLRRRSRRPTADCAQQVNLPVSQVRDAIHRARTRGLLTGSRGQGLAGGELTERALDLLQQESSTSRVVAASSKGTSPKKTSDAKRAARIGNRAGRSGK